MPTIIQDLYVQGGQSIWLDSFNKTWMSNGKLKELIQNGLRGIIFDTQSMHELIQDTKAYDKEIQLFHTPDKDPFELFDDLLQEDVRSVADLFAPIFQVTEGLDGYVSLPLDPRLFYDSELLVNEGIRLLKKIRRPNIMFQIAASDEGLRAAEELIANGINVHIVHVFSLAKYMEAQKAYTQGLQRWRESGAIARTVNSIVSINYDVIHKVFSRVMSADSTIGLFLKEMQGDLGLYTCYHVLQAYYAYLSTAVFKDLKNCGAHAQKIVWGPCARIPGQKRTILNIESYIANATIAALDLDSVDLFIEEGKVADGFAEYESESEQVFDRLKTSGVDVDSIFTKLLFDAIAKDQSQIAHLLETLKYKKKW